MRRQNLKEGEQEMAPPQSSDTKSGDVKHGRGDPSTENVNIKAHPTDHLTLTLYLILSLFSVSFFMSNTTMPFISTRLGLSPLSYGYMETFCGLLQLGGSLAFGRLGDEYGSGTALTVSMAAAVANYALLSVASTAPLLILARLPMVATHAQQAAQMLVTDVSAPSERAAQLARVGLCQTVGLILGPVCGGIITRKLGDRVTCLTAGALSTLGLAICLLYIPKKTKPVASETPTTSKPKSVFSLEKWRVILQNPIVFRILLVKLIVGIPIGAMRSMFPVATVQHFHLEPQQAGLIQSFFGVILISMNIFGIRPLTKRYSEVTLTLAGTTSLSIAWIGMGLATSGLHLALAIPFMAFGMVIQGAIMSSSLTKAVAKSDTGTVLGLDQALMYSNMATGPILAGYIYQAYGWPMLGGFGFIMCSIATAYLIVKTVLIGEEKDK